MKILNGENNIYTMLNIIFRGYRSDGIGEFQNTVTLNEVKDKTIIENSDLYFNKSNSFQVNSYTLL